MTDFNLNNPNNLNPNVREFKKLPKQKEFEKVDKINNWNEKPEVKDNGIKAIDTDKSKEVGKGKYILMIILSILGVISLLVIALAIGYTIYVDGSLVPELICSQNVTIPPCPDFPNIPSCPNCPSLTCANLTCDFPKIMNVIINNETA